MINQGKMLDPVCDMIVDVAQQRENGLTIERPEREYAFCGPGCLEKFARDPKRYIPKVEKWITTGESGPPHMRWARVPKAPGRRGPPRDGAPAGGRRGGRAARRGAAA